jgi:hypothetical protein
MIDRPVTRSTGDALTTMGFGLPMSHRYRTKPPPS